MKKFLGRRTFGKNWLKGLSELPSGSKMAELHLEVLAGLGNRIRAMVSGICLAEELGIPLVLHWYPQDRACACKLQSIFNPDSLPSFVYRAETSIRWAEDCLSVEDWNRIIQGWNKTDDIYIKSYGKFYGGTPEKEAKWLTHLRGLRPTEYIQEEVSRRLANLPMDQVLGVHIRCGDNFKAMDASPFWAFLRDMFADKALYFVVATDEELFKERLRQHFIGRCVFPAQYSERKTELGMIEAAIDFFALARCNRILGSAWSSFTDMAALYGGAELKLAQKED